MPKIINIAASDPYTSDNILFDDEKQQFIITPATTITIEHSLISLQKWEQEHCKPFFSYDQITKAEELDYIRCMTIEHNVNPNVYYAISNDQLTEIGEYLQKEMTATKFTDIQQRVEGQGYKKEIITSDIIYYWMVALQIPFEPCNKWHLNSLLALIRTVSIKNQPPKKQSREQTANAWRARNAARRAKH